MGSRTKRAAGVLAIGVAVGAGVWYWAASRSASLYWQQGARQTYKFQSRTLTQATKGGQLQHASQEIAGNLNIRVVEAKTETVRVAVQFSPLEVRHENRPDRESEQMYSQLFYATFSREGEMVAFDFPNTIAEEDQQIVANILRSLQVIVPTAGGRSWATTETDRVGTYGANYELPGAVIKTKRAYTEVFDKAGRVDIHQVVNVKQSSTKCTFGAPVTWLDACDGNELMTISTSTGTPFKISTQILLRRTEPDLKSGIALWQDSLDPRRDVAEWKSGPIETMSIARKREIAALAALVGEVPLAQYVDQVFADCPSFSGTCVNRINAYLRLHPEAAGQIPDCLLKPGLTEDQKAMLVNALQNEKSVYAQEALFRIVGGEEFPAGNRVQSVVALGDAYPPADGIVDRLWDTYARDYRANTVDKKLSDNAMLSLGRIARSLGHGRAEADRQNAKAITARLHTELANAEDPGRLSSVMYAAANTGDAAFVEPLAEYLRESETARNRAAAAQALGIFPDPAVDSAYVDQLHTENDVGVRAAIVKALTNRDASTAAVASVCANIQNEENDIVRGEMYRFMLKNRQKPEVREALVRMQAVETAMENRRLISKALAARK